MPTLKCADCMLMWEREMLGDVADRQTLSSALAELGEMEVGRPEVASAIWILKNEFEPLGADALQRALLFDRSFAIPGGIGYRLRLGPNSGSALVRLAEIARDFGAWVFGRDRERFRDRCDRYFWREMVPPIVDNFGAFADKVLNTINEAIINYAEYSFRRWCLLRRVHVHIFRTEGDLAYVIIRPSGTRLASFDPLTLKSRAQGEHTLKKRGWGHTLLMERALFLSFDRDPYRRGMLVVIGPAGSPSEVSSAAPLLR